MSTNTPSMNLIKPTIGTDSGLTWEQSTNANADTLDAHNHSSGSGTQVPSTGININAPLPFNNQPATGMQAVVFTAQASLSTASAIYFSGSDFWVNDAAGNPIQITAGGLVNATSSGIASGTATASFVSGVLVVNSNVNTPANIQAGSVLLGNNLLNSKYLTLSPPAAMPANYTLTLPSVPAGQSFVTLSATGDFGAPIPTAAGLTGSNLAPLTVTGSNIANATITANKIAAGVLPYLQGVTFTGSGSTVVPAGITKVLLLAAGGGGGGGGAGSGPGGAGGGGGGAGGQGCYPVLVIQTVAPGDTINVTIGGGGAGGAGTSGTSGNGSAGSTGGNTTIDLNGSSYLALSEGATGGAGGFGSAGGGGAIGAGGAAGVSSFSGSSLLVAGGAGGQGTNGGAGTELPGSAGKFSPTTQSSTGGAAGSTGGGGGGGGAGIGVGGTGGLGGSLAGGAGSVGATGGTSAGGGGGGGASTTGSSYAGGAGGAGFAAVYWVGP